MNQLGHTVDWLLRLLIVSIFPLCLRNETTRKQRSSLCRDGEHPKSSDRRANSFEAPLLLHFRQVKPL